MSLKFFFYAVLSVLFLHAGCKDATTRKIDSMRLALKSTNATTKKNAIRELAAMGFSAERATDDLARLTTDPDATIRGMSVLALAEVDSKGVTRTKIESLLMDPSPGVKVSAIESIAKMKGSTESAPAIHKLSESKEPAVRLAVSYAESKITGNAENQKIFTDSLGTALQERDPVTRRNAARYAGMLRVSPDRSVPILMKFASDSDTSVASTALQSLGFFESDATDALDLILDALIHRDPSMSNAAGRALDRIDPTGKKIVPKLIQRTRSQNPVMRGIAVTGLGKYKSGLDAIKGALVFDSDAEVRRQAAKALGQFVAGDAIPALLSALNDPSDAVGYSAAESLSGFSPTPVSSFEKFLSGMSLRAQLRTLHYCKLVKKDEATPVLRELSRSKYPEIRTGAEAMLKN